MLDTLQNCCRSRLTLDHKLLTNSATVAKKFTKYFQNVFCHRFKGVFYPPLSFYTLDLWPCQLWSTIESCDVVNLISKQNKLWKRFRHSLKIRNIWNLYLHCTEQTSIVLMLSPTVLKVSPLYWCYPPLYWCYPPLYWIPSTVLMLSPTVLMISPCMYPPMYWIPSTVLKLSPYYTDVIPPLYWTTSTVLKVSPTVLKLCPHVLKVSPTVLKLCPHVLKLSPRCTAVISHSSEGIPPQYWRYPSTVLMLSPTVLMLSPHMY